MGEGGRNGGREGEEKEEEGREKERGLLLLGEITPKCQDDSLRKRAQCVRQMSHTEEQHTK